MADNNQERTRRTTRKEYLLTRKQQDQYRQIRLIVFAIVALLVIILGAGLLAEYVIGPSQPVAEVNDTEISLSDWQARVSFERNQAVDQLDSLYEVLNGDVNQLSQFAGSQLQALGSPELLGEQILFQMIDEELIRQEAANRGLSVSSDEVQAAIEEQFSFYGGDPVPTPDATATPVPTPSVTPILADDAEPVEDAPAADATEAPAATPVSQEAFDEQFSERIAEFEANGSDEATYRQLTELNLLTEKLQALFADDQGVEMDELQVSVMYISFQTIDEAATTLASIQSGEKDYLTAWNEVRSADRITVTQPFGSEFQFTAPSTISTSLGIDAGAIVETMDVESTSDIVSGRNDRFLLLYLRGREVMPLTQSRIDAQERQLLGEWLEEERKSARIYEDRWLNNVPTRPLLDPKFYTPVDQPAATEGQ